MERDIRERLGSRSIRVIRQMLQMVLESAGSEMSLRRIAGASGVAVETVFVTVGGGEATLDRL